MMMDPLYQEGTKMERTLAGLKSNFPSGKGLALTDLNIGPSMMATTPELEQALLSLSGLASVPATSSEVHEAFLDGIVRELQKQQLPAQVQAQATVSSIGELSPASMVDDTSRLDIDDTYRRSAFTFDGTVPDSPTPSLPDSPRSATSSPAVSALGRGDLQRESVAALAGAPLSSLNLRTQEEMKKQRKKERNRIAAMKCRRRRLEREMDLESKVKALKQQNTDLMSEVIRLRSQVITLKQTVMTHISGGCNVFAGRA